MSLKGLLRLAFNFAKRLGWKWWMRALMVAILATLVYVLFTKRREDDRVRQGKVDAGTVSFVFLLAGYIFLVLAFTVLARAPRVLEHSVNLDLFGTLTHRLRPGSSNLYEVLLNVILFIPYGMLLPAVTRWRFVSTVLAASTLSAAIEVLQLVLSRGTCELSDVILNTSGAIVGYILFLSLNYTIKQFSTVHLFMK